MLLLQKTPPPAQQTNWPAAARISQTFPPQQLLRRLPPYNSHQECCCQCSNGEWVPGFHSPSARGIIPERPPLDLSWPISLFAEDVGLLPGKPFTHALGNWWLPNPASFPGGVGSLWRAIDQGGDFVTGPLQ